jgi:hypothetical protein
MLRSWGAEAAKGKEMTYAEVFRVVTLETDETWEKLQISADVVATDR